MEWNLRRRSRCVFIIIYHYPFYSCVDHFAAAIIIQCRTTSIWMRVAPRRGRSSGDGHRVAARRATRASVDAAEWVARTRSQLDGGRLWSCNGAFCRGRLSAIHTGTAQHFPNGVSQCSLSFFSAAASYAPVCNVRRGVDGGGLRSGWPASASVPAGTRGRVLFPAGARVVRSGSRRRSRRAAAAFAARIRRECTAARCVLRRAAPPPRVPLPEAPLHQQTRARQTRSRTRPPRLTGTLAFIVFIAYI